MTKKFKLIAAAAALAMVSTMASATISTSATPDLLFIAYDPATADTYVRDLGVSLSALSTTTTFSAPASSIFASQFADATAAGNPIQWNVVALDSTTSTFYTTGSVANFAGLYPQDLSGQAGTLTGSLDAFPQLDLPANGFAKANGEYTGVKNDTDQTNADNISNVFGFGFPVSGNGVGTSQNLVKLSPTNLNSDGTVNATEYALNSSLSAFDGNSAGGYFTLVDAQGDLKWTTAGAVAAVPLPAAGLLLAPGLMTLLGIGRKRKSAAMGAVAAA